MDERLKVLFLSSWFPSRVSPTNGDFVERHAEACAILNNVAILFVIADPQLMDNKLEYCEERKNNIIKIIIYFRKNNNRFLGKIINHLKHIYAYFMGYKRLLKTFGKPDIVHGNIIYPIVIVAFLFNLVYRIPFVFTEHWTIYLTDKIPLKKLSKILLRKCSVIIPVTENLAASLKSHDFKNNYEVVPNVVDTSKFTIHNNSNGVIRFIHISSMKELQKNICGIIKAFKKIAETEAGIRLDFVGRYSQEQIELAQKNNLINSLIFFHGEKPHSEITEFLKNADVFLLFSNYENLPCVIMEAFACGLPVISTSVGGISEHINDGNGILVQKGEINELIMAVLSIKDGYQKYSSTRIRQYAIDNFSSEVIAARFTKIYRAVLQIN